MDKTKPRLFIGRGTPADGASRRWRTETLGEAECAALIADGSLDDPGAYEADPGLVDAMNVALLLGRPLLLTGRPGTGKSQFADRLAWEFNLAPVLRFEAQSVSEARDLFYSFDMVGRMAAAQPGASRGVADARRFVTLAAMGKAVLYSKAQTPADSDGGMTLQPPHPAPEQGRASVVLIDEIDKASRDFPNDLLNAIEKLAFEMPELEGRRFEAARTRATRPLVVITSNSERELPEPFLRRCVYYHIPDPTPQRLASIVAARVPGVRPSSGSGSGSGSGSDAGTGAGASAGTLTPLFSDLVDCFVEYRKKAGRSVVFEPGTSELIDLAKVVAADPEVRPAQPLEHDANLASARRAAAAVAKGKGDALEFDKHLGSWKQRK